MRNFFMEKMLRVLLLGIYVWCFDLWLVVLMVGKERCFAVL